MLPTDLFQDFLNSPFSSQAEKPQRIGIAKVHLPKEFSWEKLKDTKVNDAAVIELKNDAQLSPTVKIREKSKCFLGFTNLPSFRARRRGRRLPLGLVSFKLYTSLSLRPG